MSAPTLDRPLPGTDDAERPFFTRQLVLFSVACAAAALGPLVLDPAREWLRPALWLVLVLSYRWLEQSVFRPSPVRGQRTGEWLFPLVYIGVVGGVLFPPLEFALMPRASSWPLLGAGVVLALAGIVLRYRAIDTLGEQLSTHLEIRPDHRLVDHGVFRHVRHPGSSGAMIFLLGAALMLHAFWSVVFIVGFLWVVLFIRMFVEERHSAALMPGYREYMRRSKRLIPFLY